MARYQFYREHKYLSFVLNDLERLIAKTDFRISEEVEKVQENFHSAVELLKGHAHYENTSLHELLRKKHSPVYEHVEKDHQHYDEMLVGLQDRLDAIKKSESEEEKVEKGYQFYLSYRKFVGDNLIHLHEEETVILPELQRLYTDEELRSVEFNTYRQMTSDQLVEMLMVLFPHMNLSDKMVFLDDIKECVPTKFEEVWSQVESSLENRV